MTQGSVLAKYDFRTKQKYIYRTNVLREIVGASMLITTSYKLFIEELEKAEIPVENDVVFDEQQMRYVNPEDQEFTLDVPDNGGKVIYIGGGNLYMLWSSREIAIKASGILSRVLRENCYGLSAVCGIAPCTGNYAKDIEKVNRDFQTQKDMVPPFMPTAILPIARVDRKTTMPVSRVEYIGREQKYLTQESYLKLCMANSVVKVSDEDPLTEMELDNITRRKGEDSLLAVIYVDGNGMGERVRKVMQTDGNGIEDYAEAVRRIRTLSNQIQSAFVTEPLREIRDLMKNLNHRGRMVVAGGDEVTLVCNAHDALKVVETYFHSLEKSNQGANVKNTACAGICIFHSHFPFSTAYDIAEQCCENAKRKNRLKGGNMMLVDFQICNTGVTGSLGTMRKNQDFRYIARPYSYLENEAEIPTLKEFEDCAERWNKIGRSNIKNMASLRLTDENEMQIELKRLGKQYPGMPRKEDLKYILDLAQVYDLWFEKGAEE